MKVFLTSSVDVVARDIIQHIDQENLKLLFIDTASEVESGDKQWLKDDRAALVEVGFDVSDYTLTNKTLDDIKQHITESDVIFFSGGNTFYLLQQIQKTGCEEEIRKFVNEGGIYIGSSAGSIVAGSDLSPTIKLDNVEKAPDLVGYKGLGVVDVVVLPHWGSDHFREAYLNNRIEQAYNNDNKIILLTDNQYLRVVDDMYEIVDVVKA